MNLKFPERIKELFRSTKRYIIIFGGRGSTKSWSVASFLILQSIQSKKRILCAREVQTSIADSVHKLLSDTIQRLGLEKFFIIQQRSIKCLNGSEFIFKGLWNNANDIKSTEGIDICWVEEAQAISSQSLELLTPTIRKEGSQIIFTYNPTNEDDAIDKEFTVPAREGLREDCELIEMNYYDNPWLPGVLKEELEYDKAHRPDVYLHKWLGKYRIYGDEIIGAFPTVPQFSTPYLVAFIDGSFSDSTVSDRTAVSIVGFVPQPGSESKYWPIEFTGMSWQKSITNAEVVDQLLIFLDRFKPIETCLESQLGDSTVTFIDRFKERERVLGVSVKNHWSWLHQTKNKHERIMLEVAGNKDRMSMIESTHGDYRNRVVSYKKKDKHEDEIDSLAGAIKLWQTSRALKTYIYMMGKKRQ
jgi:hypothetical protein